MGGSVGPRNSLDDVEKRKFFPLPVLKLRPLGRPARSQLLYCATPYIGKTAMKPTDTYNYETFPKKNMFTKKKSGRNNIRSIT
jgi:hypothetical protein